MKKIFTCAKLIIVSTTLALVAFISPKFVSAYLPIYYNYAIPYTVTNQPVKQIKVVLSATPSTMTLPTNSTIITWKINPFSEQPESCTGYGGSAAWPGAKSITSSSQNITGLEAGIYNFGIICSKPGFISSVSTVTVTVNPIVDPTAISASIKAVPNSLVFPGGQTNIIWGSSTTATSCQGFGFDTGNATSGQRMVDIAATTTYKVTCTNGINSASASTTVTVGPKGSTTVTATLTANPPSVPSGGGSSMLTWTSTNANVCEATAGAGFDTSNLTEGIKQVDVGATTTYEVMCKNSTTGESATAQATVIVLPKGVVNGYCAATHYNCSAGTYAGDGSQSGTGPYTWSCKGSGGGTSSSCSEAFGSNGLPQCSDGIDNDGDGTIDWNGGTLSDGTIVPKDPGCTGPLDTSEKNSKIKEIEI